MAKKLYCLECGTVSAPRTHTPGSFLIEVILWLCFLVPGLIYSFWRLSARHGVCRCCGSAQIIPPDAPIAQQRLNQNPPAR